MHRDFIQLLHTVTQQSAVTDLFNITAYTQMPCKAEVDVVILYNTGTVLVANLCSDDIICTGPAG